MPSESGTAASGPEARYLAEMKSDLRNLVTAEEAYFADSVKYGRSLEAMGYQPSAGVTLVVETVTREGYNATAKHVRAPGWTCGIYVGPVRPYTADQTEGSPVCWQSR
jgi:hypothetical protein